MSKIAVVGNIALDILFQVSRLPGDHEKLASEAMIVSGGGAPSNVAHWLARLGHAVDIFSVTGTDPLSGIAVDSLADIGVNVSGVWRVAGLGPSISAIFSSGEYKSMVGGGPINGASAHWAAMLGEVDLSSYDHVHILPRVHPLLFQKGRRADLRGRTASADLNGSYSPGILADLDLAFSNHDELSAQTGAADIGAMLAADMGDRPFHLLLTRAEEEVACYGPGGALRVKPEPVEAVDRTGGGDAFCAGYLHAWKAGAGPKAAIEAGLQLAAATLSALGCRPRGPAVDAAIQALTMRFAPSIHRQ